VFVAILLNRLNLVPNPSIWRIANTHEIWQFGEILKEKFRKVVTISGFDPTIENDTIFGRWPNATGND
jgi:hypothetical protein